MRAKKLKVRGDTVLSFQQGGPYSGWWGADPSHVPGSPVAVQKLHHQKTEVARARR